MKPWEMDWKVATQPKPWEMTHWESSKFEQAREPSKLSDIPSGVYSGLSNVSRGALQRWWEATGDPRADLIKEDVVAEREARKNAPTIPSVASDFSEIVGEAIPTVAAGVAAGPSLLSALFVGAGGGALRPTASPAETATNMTVEGALGLGAGLVGRTMAPRPRIEPEHLASIKAGRRAGMRFTGGQIADNPIVQRAEAHAQWNPLFGTKWHAIGVARSQDDEFVRGILKQTGVGEDLIPKNPSLNPEMLKKAHEALSERYNKIFVPGKTFDVSPSAHKGLWKALRDVRFDNLNLAKKDAAIVSDAANDVRRIFYKNNNDVPSELYQKAINIIDEATSELSEKGSHLAAKETKKLRQAMLDVLPDKAALNAADADYARLLSIEDLLRHSRKPGRGVPDRQKLSSVLERRMPGSVIRDRSTMADVARGGEASVGVGALPDRSTGLPVPSDVPNLMTYWRWNNPIAKFGLENQRSRDIADVLLRYLPGIASRKELEKLHEPTNR